MEMGRREVAAAGGMERNPRPRGGTDAHVLWGPDVCALTALALSLSASLTERRRRVADGVRRRKAVALLGYRVGKEERWAARGEEAHLWRHLRRNKSLGCFLIEINQRKK